MIWTPAFTQESHSGTREVTVRSQLLTNRKIFLQGEINSDSANEFLQQWMFLQGQGNEAIDIFVNSNGGSMAAIILAGGTKRTPLYTAPF